MPNTEVKLFLKLLHSQDVGENEQVKATSVTSSSQLVLRPPPSSFTILPVLQTHFPMSKAL